MATRDRRRAAWKRTNRALASLFVVVSALSFSSVAQAAPAKSGSAGPTITAAERRIAALAVVPTSVPKAPIDEAAVRAASGVASRASMAVGKLVVPTNGAYLGAWVDPGGQNCAGTCLTQASAQFRAAVGRPMAIGSEYLGWLDTPDIPNLETIAAQGAVPLISQHCVTSAGVTIPDSDINAGIYDDNIAVFAGQLATLKFPVLYRWMWEENNFTENDQFTKCIGSDGPAGYIAAWQRIWTIFQDAGATNVSFVWNPSASVANGCGPDPINSFTNQPYPVLTDYWPGSQFVDWAGFDYYDARTNAPNPVGTVHPDDFSGVTNPATGVENSVQCSYTAETTLWPGVPLLMGETAAPRLPNAGTQQMYINDIANNAATLRPAIKAIVWFDVSTKGDLNNDWTFSADGLRAFTNMGHLPYFSVMPTSVSGCPVGGNQTLSGTPRAIVAMTDGVCPGYWVATTGGEVTIFGSAGYYGDLRTSRLNAPIVAMAATPDDAGYWLLGADGGIFSFGDATFYGSTGGLKLNKPIVSMAATPDGGGYWLVASDGGVFAFGDASFFGSTGSMRLNAPVVGITSAVDGGGYRLVASDGGIFSFGDASFLGSMGGASLNKPIIGMTTDPVAGGYRLVASDGGVFSFGAVFYGSLAGTALAAPIVSLAPNWLGTGYYLLGADGGVFNLGSATFLGRVFG